ncbi:MAG: hypothetical protein ACREKN_05185 [Longimicrobiaceae bacterium]
MTEEDQTPAEQKDIFSGDPDDTGSIDAIVAALYRGVSFTPDGEPEWDHLRRLFLPTARLVPPRADGNDKPVAVDVDTWLAESRQSLKSGRSSFAETGFHEEEIARGSKRYGNLAQVFSVYRARRAPGDSEVVQRGVNSIQLVKSRGRWWIASIVWEVERPEAPIPEEYLHV